MTSRQSTPVYKGALALLTPQQMADADARTIAEGTAGIVLMERAGAAVKDVAEAAVGGRERSVLIYCGIGNNGGDGYVAARLLVEAGWEVSLCAIGDVGRLRGDAALAAKAWHGPVLSPEQVTPEAYTLIIDALLGAGLDREVSGALADVLAVINRTRQQTGCHVIAVDLPSGIDGSTGLSRGCAIEADETVTFYRKKPGHCLFPGRGHCGSVRVVDIGIDDQVLEDIQLSIFENGTDLFPAVTALAEVNAHKYRRGHVLVTSGGMYQTGAARLAAEAALRVGAGVVTMASPLEAMSIHAAHLTAIMIQQAEAADDILRLLETGRCSAMVAGPANGVGEDTRARVAAGLMSGLPIVLDADALTSFADDPDCLFEGCGASSQTDDSRDDLDKCTSDEVRVVLTPHEGEFRRLFPDLAVGLSRRGRLDVALEAAERSAAIVVLKGPDTVIAAPDGRVSINTNAPRWLATAGSGDVLAGLIGGLLGQGLSAFEAACAGVWLHGEAGHQAGCGLIADDLPQTISRVLRTRAMPPGRGDL